MASSSDRFVDFSLRLLTAVVGVVLVACFALLVYRWLTPPASVSPVTVVPVVPKPAAAVQATAPAPAATPEVMMAPGKLFRCVNKGRTVFSDRPCDAAPAVKQ